MDKEAAMALLKKILAASLRSNSFLNKKQKDKKYL